MLLPEQVQRLVELALAEFAPEWQVTGLCSELSLHNPDHWVSGLGTFGLILRNRETRSAKVLGLPSHRRCDARPAAWMIEEEDLFPWARSELSVFPEHEVHFQPTLPTHRTQCFISETNGLSR